MHKKNSLILFSFYIISAIVFFTFVEMSEAVNFTNGFETADLYNWHSAIGCNEDDDPGDCETPYAPPGGPKCSDSDKLGWFSGTPRTIVVGNQPDAEGCSRPGEVNYWTAGLTSCHSSNSGNGTWVLANTSAGQAVDGQSHEMAVSNTLMNAKWPGSIQVEFQFHESNPACLFNTVALQPNEHIDIAANVKFNAGTCSTFGVSESCTSGLNILNNANLAPDSNGDLTKSIGCVDVGQQVGSAPAEETPSSTAECGYVQDHQFYVVSIGRYGSNCKVAGSQSLDQMYPNGFTGFSLGKAYVTSATRSRCIVPQSAIPYPLQTGTWYRVKFERLSQNEFRYTAWVKSGANWTPTPIATYTTPTNVGTELRSRYGSDIPLGRVGFYGYWLPSNHHVDFDNVVANW